MDNKPFHLLSQPNANLHPALPGVKRAFWEETTAYLKALRENKRFYYPGTVWYRDILSYGLIYESVWMAEEVNVMPALKPEDFYEKIQIIYGDNSPEDIKIRFRQLQDMFTTEIGTITKDGNGSENTLNEFVVNYMSKGKKLGDRFCNAGHANYS